MILSTKGRYGLKAMFELGLHHGTGPVPLKVIAEKQRIPENYLEQLIAILRKAGLVRSVRGAQGGYMLMKQPENITVADVLLTLEGPLAPSECVLESESSSCDNAEKCITRTVWEKILISIHDVIDGMTLQDMIDDHQKINHTEENDQQENQNVKEQEMML
ncbi:MAG: Rrf2 family transcriptional regulator [Tindallia sp. MSAO_Bac2]|nr:MAG: Rrf2 family transcriptional regulator [Tindallia sp. MSAO_Bac2]